MVSLPIDLSFIGGLGYYYGGRITAGLKRRARFQTALDHLTIIFEYPLVAIVLCDCYEPITYVHTVAELHAHVEGQRQEHNSRCFEHIEELRAWVVASLLKYEMKHRVPRALDKVTDSERDDEVNHRIREPAPVLASNVR